MTEKNEKPDLVHCFLKELNRYYETWTEKTDRIKKFAAFRQEYKPEKNISDALEAIRKRNTTLAGAGNEYWLEQTVQDEFIGSKESDKGYSQFREKCLSHMASIKLKHDFAQKHINQAFHEGYDPQKFIGYCTASIIICLEKANQNGILDPIFDTDRENLLHANTFTKHLMTMEDGKFADKVYRCPDGKVMTIDALMRLKKLRPGAIGIFTFECEESPHLDGEKNHALVLSGKNEQGENLYISFDSDRKDQRIWGKYYGFVIDLPGIIDKMTEERLQTQQRNADSKTKKMTQASFVQQKVCSR